MSETTVDNQYKIKTKPSKYAHFMQAYKIKTPKYKFYLERGGDEGDPIILLIMGLGAQSLVWSNLFCQQLISSGYQVIRFDNRDIGKSSKLKHKNKLTKEYKSVSKKLALLSRFKLGLPIHIEEDSIPYTLFDMTEDVHQLLNALQIEKCYVIGMSMGGMIAQILAAEHPDRVEKLGLLATSNNKPFLPPPRIDALRALTKPIPQSKDATEVIENNLHLQRVIASPDFFDEKRALKRTKLLYKRRFYPKGVSRQLLALLATGSLVDIDKKIKQPTLIVHGSKDRLLPPAHGHSLSRTIPHADFRLIPGLGHDIPDTLARYLADLFAEHFR
ncbi:alpha/beta fold hydrolase [Psychrobacter phenylpyruvicus]|uniref:2-hydroxy-6-oxo-6-phenylhexa-2,4-dienoate hydrolase n=1 Tax=Psychrobacter phenylpyruvicus TaxID=29432 RepID=A0A379LJC6_9GAMM|nr:alpha/beta hydrolase [Psychrobacter phenylpyruvicus]SUD90716.1 2-hydroxy-6-oxo-6-phenylhexa-2,4-dienoate hydrolase [Psychrobacter phenylpyruvicus]